MSEAERAVMIRVSGTVQNVGYRAFVQNQAAQLGIRGWVVNRDDGSVEGALHGPGAQLGELIGLLRKGPAAATVASVDVQSTDRGRIADVPDGGYSF